MEGSEEGRIRFSDTMTPIKFGFSGDFCFQAQNTSKSYQVTRGGRNRSIVSRRIRLSWKSSVVETILRFQRCSARSVCETIRLEWTSESNSKSSINALSTVYIWQRLNHFGVIKLFIAGRGSMIGVYGKHYSSADVSNVLNPLGNIAK